MHWRNRIRSIPVLRPDLEGLDRVVLVATLALLAIGLIAVFSATITQDGGQTAFAFLRKQVTHAFIGIVGSWVLWRYLPMRLLRDKSLFIAGIAVAFLLLVHLPIIGVATELGVARWLNLGFLNVQPVEFTKIIVLIYICAYCARKRAALSTLTGFGPPLGILLVASAFLMTQPDFGSVALLAGMVLAVLFMAGARFIYFVCAGVGLAGLGVLGVLVAPYRMKRLLAFADPFQDPLGSGYQQTHSLMAFGNGGWFGSGLGQSVEKWSHLPEAHTDFIISVIAEETGFLGFAIVLGLYALIFFRSFDIASQLEISGKFFAALLARTIGLLLVVQTCINIGGNLSLLPVKGLTLPLLSYGGSSLVAWLLTLALLQVLAHEAKLQSTSAHYVPALS